MPCEGGQRKAHNSPTTTPVHKPHAGTMENESSSSGRSRNSNGGCPVPFTHRHTTACAFCFCFAFSVLIIESFSPPHDTFRMLHLSLSTSPSAVEHAMSRSCIPQPAAGPHWVVHSKPRHTRCSSAPTQSPAHSPVWNSTLPTPRRFPRSRFYGARRHLVHSPG